MIRITSSESKHNNMLKHTIIKSFLLLVAFSVMTLSFTCKGESPRVVPTMDHFVKGADIGWLPQMEASGYKFLNAQGVQEDCFKILKDHGINAIRLRTWVNPSDSPGSGHCSKDETVAMAVRAQKWGMQVMIDFHYSDTWADPAKQIKPKAWEGHDFPQLLKDVYDYTFDLMTALKTAGVTPAWLQVGNETRTGMIY